MSSIASVAAVLGVKGRADVPGTCRGPEALASMCDGDAMSNGYGSLGGDRVENESAVPVPDQQAKKIKALWLSVRERSLLG